MVEVVIISILVLLFGIATIKYVNTRTKLKEAELRYSILKKSTTEEQRISNTNEVIKTQEDMKRLLVLLRNFLRGNPVGIITTPTGNLVRRSFEIKQSGNIECRRRKKGTNDEVKRTVVQLGLAFENNDYKEFITREDLLYALKKSTPKEVIEALIARTTSISEGTH